MSVRVIIHGTAAQVIDFEEWYLNLTEANANPKDPQWKQLYSSVNLEYGLKSQAPSEWNNMIERMKTDDGLFEKYRENYYRRSKFDGIGECNEDCKKGWLCSARQMHHSNTLCADLGSFVERKGRNSYHRKPTPVVPTRDQIRQALFARKQVRANDQCPL
ncbi:hypothetical protein TELCIR_08359 [Teladorsagia circumcincta]|uniref:Sphingomyelin phosphodiesterase C-terminal domain-containing protein n=1 Tax=Teladorsagia circumcincta TaxID=45464 RepID=A0A2G9UHT1_TELCI|nr:hypothetical protein TELCIR_08359 [Teladorsagia circumcincta]